MPPETVLSLFKPKLQVLKKSISLHELVTANLNEVFLILGTNFSTCKENERRAGSLLYKRMWYHYLRQKVHVKTYKMALDYLIKM